MKREFREISGDYYVKCENAGQMVRIEYTSRTYDDKNQPIDKDALVYLPYGYDTADTSYNVFYLMHGGGGNSDEVFGGQTATTALKNILDNMIERGDMEPLIVVAPSFYYKGTDEALTSGKDARLLTQNFHHELVRDLLPEIEKNFRVKTGREHRAFGGYSMGAEATWNVFARCLGEFQYFLPMSGDCWAVEQQGGLKCPIETVDYLVNAVKCAGSPEYRVFACVGDNGVAYKPMDTMIQEMRKRTEVFRFAQSFLEGNMIYCVAERGTHSYEYCYQYIFNALPLFF